MVPPEPAKFLSSLEQHLNWWGLRHFSSGDRYDEWQRQTLSAPQLKKLNRLAETKRRTHADRDEISFYDSSAHPNVLPVLYSQRYHYYRTVGSAIASRIGHARRILDFGCGPGILTSFYARQFPTSHVVGLDRSRASIEVARQRAEELGLANVAFVWADVVTTSPRDQYDLIISSQALFQAEQDPGLPSRSWQTFERDTDATIQQAWEERTGLAPRLDGLCALLAPEGSLMLFEKAGHLARRIPFQRALATRGFSLCEPPSPIRYDLVEEPVCDECLYVVTRAAQNGHQQVGLGWDESPTTDARDELYSCQGPAASSVWARLPQRQKTQQHSLSTQDSVTVACEIGEAAEFFRYLRVSDGGTLSYLVLGGPSAASTLTAAYEALRAMQGKSSIEFRRALHRVGEPAEQGEDPLQAPLYENHSCAAQSVWHELPTPQVLQKVTASGVDNRQLHIEYGTSKDLVFVYCANTLDQRQLVVMDQSGQHVLEDYYAELLEANHRGLDREEPTHDPRRPGSSSS